MPTIDRPSVQAVVNAIVQTLKDESKLESLEYYQTPHYQQATMGHPLCHVFAMRRVLADHASPKRYLSTLEVAIVVMMPSPEQDSNDRALHRIEELIEDVLLRNQQIPLGNLPDDISWMQTKIESIDYLADEEAQLVVDSFAMIINVSYTRVVV